MDVLKPKTATGKDFLKRLRAYAEKCTYYGALNSLSLVALKVCAPGIPDFYQGCEMWDLSLVDPDNRRAVDYPLRKKLLKELQKSSKQALPVLLKDLTTDWRSGRIKLWLTWKLLQMRLSIPELFTEGEYIAIEPAGDMKQHYVAFMRKYESRWVFVVVPRFMARQQAPQKRLAINSPALLSTHFDLPADAPQEWTHVFSGKTLQGSRLVAQDLFADFPMAVLIG